MDFPGLISFVANIATIASFIWVVVFGSQTIRDVIKPKPQQSPHRLGRILLTLAFIIIVVFLIFMPIFVKFIGFTLIASLAPFLFFGKRKTWLYNKLLQSPSQSIRVLLPLNTVLLIYSLIATLFLFQSFTPTFLASSFPIELKCSTCSSNDFNVVIRFFTSDNNGKTITLDTTVTSIATNSLHFFIESSLISPNSEELLGQPNNCSTDSCGLDPNASQDINVIYAFVPPPGASYTLRFSIKEDFSGTVVNLHFDPAPITFRSPL